ncbi:putative hemolysin [Thermomonospora echinospora]|uniref:Putative hemolysin n=1 Tax=Thermomonospora echinospora TaxID=1992 RepID=A0A1H5ZHX9_9ACTN|nr:hemolysin family protein [Thermomonospora echinospora]SEG35237.1 putative hemolysin [Thermomonospora echinospora]
MTFPEVPQYAQYAGLAVLVVLACCSRPVLWLLSRLAGRLAGRLAPPRQAPRPPPQEAPAGERATVAGRVVQEELQARLAVADRQLREVLVPRTEVRFLDARLPLHEAARSVAASPHSRFPVYRDSHDEVIGFVHVRDLLDPAVSDRRATCVGDLVRPVKYLPASMRVLSVLSQMRRERHHLAIVMDEYGGTAGIVTLEDLVEELIGDIRDEYDVQDAQARRLHGGAVEVDGLLNLDAFAAETGIRLPPGPYETVAGHLMAVLGRVPAAGDAVESAGHRLTVAGMDGRRVARVRVMPLPPPADRGEAPGPGAAPNLSAAGGVPEDDTPRDVASDGA